MDCKESHVEISDEKLSRTRSGSGRGGGARGRLGSWSFATDASMDLQVSVQLASARGRLPQFGLTFTLP